MIFDVKLQIARAQLGTALDLFINDLDPISVHALACGGCEIMDGIALERSASAMSRHILAVHTDIDQAKLARLRNQHWNAIKHFYENDKKTARDDVELMNSFADSANDAALFTGWADYMTVTGKAPIEVQVFQVWWFAMNEDKLNPEADKERHRAFFPHLASFDRAEQKRRLRAVTEAYRGDPELLADPKTENAPLVALRN